MSNFLTFFPSHNSSNYYVLQGMMMMDEEDTYTNTDVDVDDVRTSNIFLGSMKIFLGKAHFI